MVSDPERERLRGVISSLMSHSQAPDAVGRGEESSLVDATMRAFGSTLDRWTRGAPVRRLIGGVERDVLTSAGEWVALEGAPGLPAKFVGVAQFWLDEQLVAEVEVGRAVQIRAMIRAPGPGLYRVAVGSGGTRPRVGHALLQVSGDRPVALIDAAMLFDPASQHPPRLAPHLHELIAAGFELAYFDIGEKDRRPAILDVVAHHRLPEAACLVYDAATAAVESLGVDLAGLFSIAAVHRLRGKGVPVVMVVTERFHDARDLLGEVSVVAPYQLARRLADEGDALARERELAAAFVAARAQADPLGWRLDQSTTSRSIVGNAVVAELDNRRARERLFQLIDDARSSIHMQVYIIRAGEFADELVVRLVQRARAGVRVRFMVDALYSDADVLGRTNPSVEALAAEPNIEVIALAPIGGRHHVEVSRLKQRDHRKLVIIDGERAIVSGRNAADPYYRGFDELAIHDQTQHDRIPWLDAHVELAGPIVAEVQRCFLDTWSDAGGSEAGGSEAGGTEAGGAADAVATLPAAGSVAARLVVHHGLVDANGLAMYESLLEAADDHVIIVNDFPFVSVLERAILRLLARGVTVELLTGNAAARRDDGTLFPAPVHRILFEHMVKARLEPLMLAGVRVYEFATPVSPRYVARGARVRPYVHAKLVTVDGRACSIGSANLDATASFWESEANVVIEDREFCRALEQQLRELIDGSFALDPLSEYWQRERAQRAVVGTLWPASLYS